MWFSKPKTDHDAGRVESSPEDRGLAVSAVVRALSTDPAWSSLKSDAERRTTAKRLLSTRWLVREGRLTP